MKQRFAISNVAIHKLACLFAHGLESTAESRISGSALTGPADFGNRLKVVSPGHMHRYPELRAKWRNVVGRDEKTSVVDDVVAAKSLVEVGGAVRSEARFNFDGAVRASFCGCRSVFGVACLLLGRSRNLWLRWSLRSGGGLRLRRALWF